LTAVVAPIDPVWAMTTKLIAKVANTVAVTRRRSARTRLARARSAALAFARAASAWIGSGAMATTLGRLPATGLRAA
jgi:hypothetical protein